MWRVSTTQRDMYMIFCFCFRVYLNKWLARGSQTMYGTLTKSVSLIFFLASRIYNCMRVRLSYSTYYNWLSCYGSCLQVTFPFHTISMPLRAMTPYRNSIKTVLLNATIFKFIQMIDYWINAKYSKRRTFPTHVFGTCIWSIDRSIGNWNGGNFILFKC